MKWWDFLTVKFYLGILFVALSLIIGKITTVMFFYYFNDAKMRGIAIILYILSWPLLILGVYWIGKEYNASIKKYITYQYYHESIRKGTQKALYTTKRISKSVKNKFGEMRKRGYKIPIKLKVKK